MSLRITINYKQMYSKFNHNMFLIITENYIKIKKIKTYQVLNSFYHNIICNYEIIFSNSNNLINIFYDIIDIFKSFNINNIQPTIDF